MNASDKAAAIVAAIEQFAVPPRHQRRLLAPTPCGIARPSVALGQSVAVRNGRAIALTSMGDRDAALCVDIPQPTAAQREAYPREWHSGSHLPTEVDGSQ